MLLWQYRCKGKKNGYWALNGHKYLEQRSKDNDLKLKHREYNNNIYSERPKHIHQNNYFNPTFKNDLLLGFLLTTTHNY